MIFIVCVLRLYTEFVQIFHPERNRSGTWACACGFGQKLYGTSGDVGNPCSSCGHAWRWDQWWNLKTLITLHVKMSVSAECDEFETAQKAVCDLFRRGQISEPFDSIKYNDAGTNNSEDILQWRWNDTTFSFPILNTETLSTSQYWYITRPVTIITLSIYEHDLEKWTIISSLFFEKGVLALWC